jgi:insertion element IS1 protein InsB
MSYSPTAKKTNKIYIWLAVDRDRREVIDFEVTESREFSAYLPMAMRLEEAYKIEISCSDYYDVYGKYRISKERYMTKSETSLVESFNSLLRHYLARFNRKTKRYSKAVDMIYPYLCYLIKNYSYLYLVRNAI